MVYRYAKNDMILLLECDLKYLCLKAQNKYRPA